MAHTHPPRDDEFFEWTITDAPFADEAGVEVQADAFDRAPALLRFRFAFRARSG